MSAIEAPPSGGAALWQSDRKPREPDLFVRN
jgi:hypothetical protein